MTVLSSNIEKIFSQGNPPIDPLYNALNSYSNLKAYLDPAEEIEYLKRAAEENTPRAPLSHSRWQMAAHPFQWKLNSALTRVFNMTRPSIEQYFPNSAKSLHARLTYTGSTLLTPFFINEFKDDLLVRSNNAHQVANSDFYLHPSLPIRTHCESVDGGHGSGSRKEFDCRDGLCEGMADWLTYLYFKTKHLFADEESHLIALSQLFENGAPRKAALLQQFQWTDGDLKDHILEFKLEQFSETKNEDQEIREKRILNREKTGNSSQTQQFLKELPNGVYRTTIDVGYGSAHAVRYFKIHDELGFIFDPNIGLIKRWGDRHYDKAMEGLKYSAKITNLQCEYTRYTFQQITPQSPQDQSKKKYRLMIEH